MSYSLKANQNSRNFHWDLLNIKGFDGNCPTCQDAMVIMGVLNFGLWRPRWKPDWSRKSLITTVNVEFCLPNLLVVYSSLVLVVL